MPATPDDLIGRVEAFWKVVRSRRETPVGDRLRLGKLVVDVN